MKIWITGGAGTLGSTLADELFKAGYDVSVNDIIRKDEAWKLESRDQIPYHWISTIDLPKSMLNGVDIIIDCGIGYADRPFGIESPMTNYLGNIAPAVNIVKQVSKMKRKPTIIYPSSYNQYYGFRGTYTEETPLTPNSEYGWTKAAVTMLYFSAHRQYNIPFIGTVVGSEFGPKMRSDELIGKLILYLLQNKDFKLRSPGSERLWGYIGDAVEAYRKIIDKYDEFNGYNFHISGNNGDTIVSNINLAHMVKEVIQSRFIQTKSSIYPVGYEPGETVNGKPISFHIDSSFTRKTLNWSPKHTLVEGLKETVDWFRENIWRYQ